MASTDHAGILTRQKHTHTVGVESNYGQNRLQRCVNVGVSLEKVWTILGSDMRLDWITSGIRWTFWQMIGRIDRHSIKW